MSELKEFEGLKAAYKTIVERDGHTSPKAAAFRNFFNPHYGKLGVAAVQQVNKSVTQKRAADSKPQLASQPMKRFVFPKAGKPLPPQEQPVLPAAHQPKRGRPAGAKRNPAAAGEDFAETQQRGIEFLKTQPFSKWTAIDFAFVRTWLQGSEERDFSQKSDKQIFNHLANQEEGYE